MSVQIGQPVVNLGDRVKILKTKGSKKWVGCTALVIEVADGGQTIHAEIEGQSGLRLIFDPTWLELVPLEESKDSNPSLEQQPTTAKPQQDTSSSQQYAPSEEPYEFSKCTITVGIQFLPDDGSGDRQVVVGVRNHADPPILKLMRQSELGELPPAIVELLASLESDLPNRQAALSERLTKEQATKAKRPTVTQTANQSTGSKQINASKPKPVDSNTSAQMSLFELF